jgi:HSP20 family protein
MDDILQRITESEVTKMLMRTDPFRDLDRFTQQALGTAARPAVMPMDAWREGDAFFVEFDLPGIDQDSLDLDIERNVVTVRAQRPALDPNREMLATERPRGVFSRQLVLGENLDTERIEASYHEGVLRLHIPVAEKAKPRKITIGRSDSQRSVVNSNAKREVIDA